MRHRYPKRSGFIDFLKGFALTLVAILPVFTAVYLIIQSNRSPDAIPQQGETSEKVEIAVRDNRTLLVLAENGRSLLSASLVRFDVDNERVIVCDIPTCTVLLLAKTPFSVEKLFREKGALGVRDAVEETLGLPVDFYLSVPKETLAEIVDELGRFSFTLDKELSVKSEEGLVEMYLESGTRELSGGEAAALLEHGEYYYDEKVALHERMWRSALLDFTAAGLGSKAMNLYLEHSADLEADLNSVSAYALAGTIKAACGSSCDVATLRLSGRWIEDRFELDEDNAEPLSLYYAAASDSLLQTTSSD